MAIFGKGRAGRRQAFEQTALPHLDALYGLAIRLTRDEREAEDLVQDAMVRALRFWDRFEPGTNARAWLFTIVANTFYNRYRKARNQRRLEARVVEEGRQAAVVSAASAEAAAGEARALDMVSTEEIRAAIDELPEDFRVAVLLCDVHDLSYREIAEAMGCPVGTVMSRLHRARRILKRRLHAQAAARGLVPAVEPGAGEPAPPADLAAYRRRRGEG